MAISFSDRVRVAPDVLFRLVSDEAVLVNLKTEVYLGLNAVGSRMWTILGAASSIEAAYGTLLQEYDVDPAQLRSDIEEFVEQLAGQQLIETASADV